MKYVITGITGFAGPHLANLLISEGHEVVGMVRSSNGREDDIRDIVPDEHFKKIKFVYGDFVDLIRMKEVFKQETFDGVFHLGAQSHPPTSFTDPMGTMRTNVQGSICLLEAVIAHQPETCKFMFCSTSEVYGAVPKEAGEINESFPLAPVNPYGVSKASAEMYVLERAASLKRPFFSTRAFSHTGTRRGRMFSISSDAYQIARIIKGLQEPVIKVGNLSSERVVMDARDCVKAYYQLMDKASPGEAYNVGGDEFFSMGDILDIMLDIKGLSDKVEKKVDEKLWRPIDIPVQIPDSSKLRDLTGWKPEIPLRETLKDLLQYWEDKIN